MKKIALIAAITASFAFADTNTTSISTTTSPAATSSTDANFTSAPPAPPPTTLTKIVAYNTFLENGWNMVSFMGYKPVNLKTLFPASTADFIKAVYVYDTNGSNYRAYKPGLTDAQIKTLGYTPVTNVNPDKGMWINVSDRSRINYRINLANPDDTQIRLIRISTNATITPPPAPPMSTITASGTIDETVTTASTDSNSTASASK